MNNRPPSEHIDMQWIRDGRRLDILSRYQWEGKWREKSYKDRVTIDGPSVVTYTVPSLNPGERPKQALFGTKDKDVATEFNAWISSAERACPLYGYCPSSEGKRLAELLGDALDLQKSKEETIDDIRCVVLQGHTPYGAITMWLAPSHGACCLKAVYEKGLNDLIDSERRLAAFANEIVVEDKPQSMVNWTCSVDNVRLREIPGGLVPTSGQCTIVRQLSAGGRMVETCTYICDDIRLLPQDGPPLAFVTDLPDNVKVVNMDDRDSGVIYVWHKGKPVPAYSQFNPDGPDRFSHTGSIRILIAWTAMALLFIGFGSWLFLRRRARRL
jgi:hypothetical protein